MMSGNLEKQLVALANTSSAQLRSEWLRLYKTPAPAITADLLRRGVAWKMQEKVIGAYDAAIRRRIEKLCQEHANPTSSPKHAPAKIKPGTLLVRDWGGESHHVTVLNDGYRYRDQHYRSLSRLASTITGAKWSGPRFFGIARSRSAIDA